MFLNVIIKYFDVFRSAYNNQLLLLCRNINVHLYCHFDTTLTCQNVILSQTCLCDNIMCYTHVSENNFKIGSYCRVNRLQTLLFVQQEKTRWLLDWFFSSDICTFVLSISVGDNEVGVICRVDFENKYFQSCSTWLQLLTTLNGTRNV